MATNDVIVFDEEYQFAAQQIENYCDALYKMMDSYSKNIKIILEYAIRDKEISTELNELVDKVEYIKPQIKSIGNNASSTCRDFVSKIDEADKFLY